MNRPWRVVTITAGLILTGAVVGALAGAVSLTTSLWIDRDPWYVLGLFAGPLYGAPIGAVVAPVLAWTVLRRVALGQMFMWLGSGTAIGGLVGWITTVTPMEEAKVMSGLAGAVVGCLVAAIRVRYHARRLEACRSASRR